MDALPNEEPVRVVVAAPAAATQPTDTERALTNVRSAFPRTRFDAAWPSGFPGLVALRLGNGDVAYTDKNGRYLMLGLIFDSATGTVLDRKLDGRPE